MEEINGIQKIEEEIKGRIKGQRAYMMIKIICQGDRFNPTISIIILNVVKVTKHSK